MQPKPLSKIRVLDLSRILAGPMATQLLADLGAEVIKVERPNVGDDARRYGPPFLKDDAGNATNETPMYLSANRNKKSVTIDLSKPKGQALVRRLAAMSDVIVENYKVGDLTRYGLDYPSIKQVNPKIVYCSVTGFGQSGPYKRRPGYDPIFQAMCGLMSVTGEPDGVIGGGPVKAGPSIIDVITALFASNAIQAALYHRDVQGGQGQHIDLALLDCGIAAMSHHAMQYLISGVPPARCGSAGNGGAPSGVFHCANGDIMLSAGNDTQFQRLMAVLGSPELGVDPKFVTNALRIHNRREIVSIVADLVRNWDNEHLTSALNAVSVPAGPINNLAQVFADVHVRHRGMVVEGSHALSGTVPMVGSPIRFSETPVTDYIGAPVLGQHTREVLHELLDLDDDIISNLSNMGIV